ncbi:VCBS repeat-containing protein [Rhodanobacter sp. 7MK24]|uniref:protease pro-enzyme activation domain-containing protein n=1 Tax=Rhodanobacter sp. 7MK24 TaxID=2775922 RepID=UPI00178236C5|nr:protease pro-enzyme activation domain-containing protein [Rhodanobacter sp. 7MK24]MBD8879305.1 VCBS repeat-containing protein [Rhodanobacter sp. 7MK24]
MDNYEAKMFSGRRIKNLVVAAVFAALANSMSIEAKPVAGDITASASAKMEVLHPAAILEHGDKTVGLLDVSQPIHVVIPLKLRNEQQLDQYIAKPGFRPLSSGQFQMLYAPTKEQAQAVADYLVKAGFSNVKIARGNTLVEADGRADTAEAAFSTSFVQVKTHDGRDAFANSSAVQIPASLRDSVRAVLGMQNVHIFHAMTRHYDPVAVHAMAPQVAASAEMIGHPPSDFPAIYGASGMPNVTSVPVGSISAGPMANVLNDLKSVDPGVTITLMGDTSVGNGSGSNSSDDEFDLDSQTIIAFTGVKQYYFYVSSSMSDADLEADFARVVSDNVLKAIDISMDECETDARSDGAVASMDATFKQAVAQGQTFFVSAGDNGPNGCGDMPGSSWPASSQYVTAVGGTELFTSPSTTLQQEQVWSDLNGTTVGGPSLFEPIPGWQQGVAGITNQTYRGVPDIAFDGDPSSGALITVDGNANQQIGGTSLSAPLAVGMWAHVLQANGTALGFASPVIYKTAQPLGVNYYSGFNDVNYGNNFTYDAVPGWDYTSGWGSIQVAQFARLAANANYTSSAPFVSFATLPALQVTTPIPGSTHTPGDFNGDGVSDIVWFNPSQSQVGLWTMSALAPNVGTSVTRTGLKSFNVAPGYFIGAVGDFNDDGYADLVFTSANRDLYLWTNNQQGGWVAQRISTSSYPSQWQLIGAGDVDGDGHDDLLWLDPSGCKFGYWTMNGATVTGSHTINVACGYYPISIGYYTSSNRLSIIWTSAAHDLYVWDSTGGTTGGTTGNGFNAYSLTSALPANSHIMSIGGGYQGQNMGLQVLSLSTDGTYDLVQGLLLSRSFDASGNQTGIQSTYVFDNMNPDYIGSVGYVIAGNGVNDTGVYDIDPYKMLIGTGGLYSVGSAFYTGNASAYPIPVDGGCTVGAGYCWQYPAGWWVVGAPFNGAAAPPWR